MRKFAVPVVLVLVLVSLQGVKYANIYTGGKLVPLPTAEKVIVVYESLNQPAAEASVMNGVTARALKKADKWRQYDKDKIPESLKPILSPVVAKEGIPCLILFGGGKVIQSSKFPGTDAALAEATK